MNGTIVNIIHKRGYGFIRDENGNDIFFHKTALNNIKWGSLKNGVPVTFETDTGDKGVRAVNINIADEPDNSAITVTKAAEKRLHEIHEKYKDSQGILRIVESSSDSYQFDLTIGEKKKNDYVVVTDSNITILAISPKIIHEFRGKIIDYSDGPQFSGFFISETS